MSTKESSNCKRKYPSIGEELPRVPPPLLSDYQEVSLVSSTSSNNPNLLLIPRNSPSKSTTIKDNELIPRNSASKSNIIKDNEHNSITSLVLSCDNDGNDFLKEDTKMATSLRNLEGS